MPFLLGHDVGTSGTKTVLVDHTGRVLATHVGAYGITHAYPAFAEQDPLTLYEACAAGTRAVLAESGVDSSEVRAMAFAGQMLALASLDARGGATRPLISWMDARADVQAERLIRRFGGERVLHAVAGASPTAKDLICKMAWIKENEPEVYARTAAFTDATGYLVARTTGVLAIDHTAAGATGMIDVRSRRWSAWFARLSSFPLDKMPKLRACSDVVGALTPGAARDFGLTTQTRVVMGLADVPAAAVGSGAVRDGDVHLYLGTSAWLGRTTKTPMSIPSVGIASVPFADPALALAIGESETAGACRAWLEKLLGEGHDLETLAARSDDGARGLLFVPWMYGERAPYPDASVRGAFLHLSLEHDASDMIRALYEGVGYNLRWTSSAIEPSERTPRAWRAIGGGTRSDVWMQTIADITDRTIERVEQPHFAGARGAALLAGVGIGLLARVADARDLVHVEKTFRPRVSSRALHEKRYGAFREIAPSLSRIATRIGASG